MQDTTNISTNESSLDYYGWVVLLAAVVGMIFSSGPMLYGSIGLFVSHFESAFGWTRPEIMFALMLNTIATVISAPICGRLIDRFGTRKVLLPSILAFALLWASVPYLTGSLTLFYFIIFMIGLLTVGTQSITYIRIVSAWFNQKRGLAIGITASGIGLSYMITPLIVSATIEQSNWQNAYWVMAAMVLFISFPLMFFAIRNSPIKPPGTQSSDNTISLADDNYGLTLKQAIRTREFWVVSITILIFSLLLTGLIPHVVPIMRELEFDLKTSAQIASVMGLSTFLGRVGVGFLVDRIFAPYVAMAFFGCSAVGFLLISGGISSNTAYLAALLLGLGFGAESDLIGYFVSRYFGLKNFGEIYGYIYGAFLIGAGAGPLLLGFGYDYFNGYQGLLRLFGIVCAFSCFLFLLLPPFPTLATSQTSLDKPTHSSVSVN